MNMALYSPEDITILLGGIYQVEGLHEGSFVSITKDNPLYNTKSTTDGKVTRIQVAENIHTVEITVSATASVNQIFSAWAAADGYLYGAIIPLFIKDDNGTTMFYSPSSWIEEPPTVSFSTEVDSRVWKIKCAGATLVVGGNTTGLINSNLAALGFLAADFGGLL